MARGRQNVNDKGSHDTDWFYYNVMCILCDKIFMTLNFTGESAWSLPIAWCPFGTRTLENNFMTKVVRRIITAECAQTRLQWCTKIYYVASIYLVNLFFMLIELFACFQIQNLGMNRKNYHYLLCTMVSIKYLLRLCVLNFRREHKTYIYILCHSSTLIWHRWSKSFLK